MRATYRSPSAVLIALAALLLIDGGAWSGTDERRELPPSPWRAVSASGQVESRSFVHLADVEWRPVERGDLLRSHSEVRTPIAVESANRMRAS